MNAKAWVWLQRGTRLVWVLWPKRKEIDVWTQQREEPVTLRAGDQLDGGDVLPGFVCPVADIFTAPAPRTEGGGETRGWTGHDVFPGLKSGVS